MAGVYMTPMPPHSSKRQTAGTGEMKEGSSICRQSATMEHSDMGEVEEQRPNRRHGPHLAVVGPMPQSSTTILLQLVSQQSLQAGKKARLVPAAKALRELR